MVDLGPGASAALAVDRPAAGVWLKSFNIHWLHPRLVVYLATAVTLLALLPGLHQDAGLVNSVWFVAADATGIALALVIGFIAFACYQSFSARSLLFLAIGFIGSGLIDSINIVQAMGLDQEFIPGIYFASRNWSSLAARLFLAIMLLMGWRASEGRISLLSAADWDYKWIIALSTILLGILLAAALIIPRVTTPGEVAAVIPVAKSITGLLYFITLFIFLRRRDWRYFPFQHWLTLSLILVAISQLFYLPLVGQSGDSLHLAGNGLRLGSYFLVFAALLSSTANLLRQAGSMQLEDRINELISRHGNTAVEGLASAWVDKRFTKAGTFKLDLVTGQIDANQIAIGLLGGPDSTSALAMIKQFGDIVHPEDWAKFLEALGRSRDEGALFKQQFRVKSPGGYRWLEAGGGVEWVDGKPIKLLGFVDDISGRKAMELEKDRLYRELEQIIAAVDQYAVIAKLDLDGVIKDVNDLFCQFCGVEEKALIGRRFDSVMMKHPAESTLAEIGQCMRDGSTWKGLVALLQSTDHVRTANASVIPHLNDEDEIDAFVFLGIDVSDRVANTRALGESVEAHKKSNDELQLFAHIVSHDLQEPLRMVSSFMTLLERRYAAELNDEAKEFIQFAVEGSTRMRNLLDGLLEYSRVRSSDLRFEELNLKKPVADAMANLANLIRDTGAEISLGAMPEIRCDCTQLMQLFQNLIANGIKFCRSQPPKITIEAHCDEGNWVVEVSDNGIGIDPSHHERIFQIFCRLHPREAYPGTGVGLAVCKQIMERHGGRIEVGSVPEQGTTFKLCF